MMFGLNGCIQPSHNPGPILTPECLNENDPNQQTQSHFLPRPHFGWIGLLGYSSSSGQIGLLLCLFFPLEINGAIV